MTKKEIDLRSKMKVDKINLLLTELNVSVRAEEMIGKDGIIRKVVFYQDNEKYPEDNVETSTV